MKKLPFFLLGLFVLALSIGMAQTVLSATTEEPLAEGITIPDGVTVNWTVRPTQNQVQEWVNNGIDKYDFVITHTNPNEVTFSIVPVGDIYPECPIEGETIVWVGGTENMRNARTSAGGGGVCNQGTLTENTTSFIQHYLEHFLDDEFNWACVFPSSIQDVIPQAEDVLQSVEDFGLGDYQLALSVRETHFSVCFDFTREESDDQLLIYTEEENTRAVGIENEGLNFNSRMLNLLAALTSNVPLPQ